MVPELVGVVVLDHEEALSHRTGNLEAAVDHLHGLVVVGGVAPDTESLPPLVPPQGPEVDSALAALSVATHALW